MREWYRRPGNAQRQRESQKRARVRNLEAVRARDRARGYRVYDAKKEMARRVALNAIRRGDLVREACEVCGTTERVEAHHDDYDRPLDVRWLCITHHGEEHRMVA